MALTTSIMRRLVLMLCARLPAEQVEILARRLAQRLAADPSPADALGALLRLDHLIYKLEGTTAVRYGKGEHPKHRLTNYHRFFIDRIHAGERVLDVGSGKGELTSDLAASGADVVGLDYDPQWIEYATREHSHPRVTYVLGDVYGKLPHGPFDVVVLSNVLEHLQGREALLAHLQSAVAPKRILIRVPVSERDWRVPLKREFGIEWRLDPTHETEYTIESFNAEIAAAGLAIVEMQVRWGEIWAVVAGRRPGHAGP